MSDDRFKFRVWDNINKRYDKELTLIDKDGDVCYQDGGKYCNGEHPEDFTIEQCTGLTDKNGKLIYEGDVVVGSWNTKLIVFWDAISASYRVKPLDNCGGDRELHYYSNMDGTLYYNYEIIGNIHDDQFRDATKMVEDNDNE